MPVNTTPYAAKPRAARLALPAVLMLTLPGLTHAAGFYIQEQSVSGLGRAFAGDAALAADASTIFFNPAGMTALPGSELQLAAHLLIPTAKVSNHGSTVTAPGTQGQALGYAGGSGGNPYGPSPVPNLFYATPVNELLWFGFGITAPFGLANDYKQDFFARYDSTETALTVINLQPSLAVALTPSFSIGAGLDVQYADATLEAALPDPTQPGGPTPGSDGYSRLSADHWGYGFNLGMQWALSPQTRVGAHYRYGIKHTLTGSADINPPASLAAFGRTAEQISGKADLHLPDIFSLGLVHQVGPQLNLLAQYTWFQWSNFDEIRVRFADGRADDVTVQNYRDSWALALGAEYQWDERWTLRGGIQFDQTPTQDGYRTTRTPDGDRTWFSFGASYAYDARLGFDLAYTYIDIAKESLDLSRQFYAQTPLATQVNLQGTTQGDVHILAGALRYRF
ncbi:OmpP1/FadL family transporter [Thiorhodospira sibirica]|uniref:OmpP1/FadL family transporter n=1 Tax=Thiorhodospira sibirica TaxID=154347 RepID=UPI00022C1182|nr:outer membrane protein transport protein [Thiorhodospira sibirica]